MPQSERRRFRGGFESIGHVIEEVISQGRLGGCGQVAGLWKEWRHIVGEDVAEHCFPEKISGDKLYIRVDSSVWRQQLDLLKEEVKEKIEEKFQQSGIENIVFRVMTDRKRVSSSDLQS